MLIDELPVDPSGFWSPRQAARVLDAINPIALKRGVIFHTVDVTTFNMPAPRVIIVAYCLKHDIAIVLDSVCGWCVLEAPAPRQSMSVRILNP